MVKIKAFTTKEEEFQWLFDNRNELTAQRKAVSKESDAISFLSFAINERGEQIKADNPITDDLNIIKVRCIINTTGLMDSHRDVHIPGIWKKSLSETKGYYLVQEHKFDFKGIISDMVKSYTKDYQWRDLGYRFEGKTQALVFDVEISKDRNEYMFDQYKKGYVKNHSVGMRYVKDYLCINSTDHLEQKENWDKYIKYVSNKEEAEAVGYFWAVTEAKIIEGSAVVKGSNYATPTLEIKEDKTEADAVNVTPDKTEPSSDTQTGKKQIIIINSNIY